MRAVVIVEAMHDHLIEARRQQLERVVGRTQRAPRRDALPATVVRSEKTGFVLEERIAHVSTEYTPR
jgi:hypothetical protein